MASKAEKNPAAAEKEEGKIPVLTVLKNNAILKNIFIVNKPPEHSARDHEDIFLVGRHPDCDLMLTHPSISRFHLQICSKPSSQTLYVIDLSSVHGTWVSGRKIEPGVSVEMKEGDMLRIGVSSRVYRLHWISISRAYDLENPFVSELYVVLEEDEEQEQEVEEKVQNLNCCPVDMEEIQSMDSILECINSLFLDENLELTVKKEILSAHLIPEDIISLYCEEERKSPSKDETFGVSSEPFGTGTSYSPTISNGENKLCDSLNHVLSPPYVESVAESNNQGQSLVEAVQDIGNTGSICPISLQIESENSPMIQEAVLNVTKENQTLQLDMEILESCIEALENNSSICNIWSRRGKATSAPMVQTSKSILKSTANADAEFAMNNEKDIINKTISKDLFSVLDGEEEEIFTPDKENFSPNTLQLRFMKNKRGNLEEIKHFKSRRSHNSKDNLNLGIYPDESISFTLSKENQKDIINKTISKDLFTDLNGEEEEEIFTPDKENFSPNALQLRLMKKKGKTEEIECSKCYSSQNLKDNFGSSIYPDENISLTLSKENQKDIINKTISKDLFSVLDGEEEEIFTPDKENFSPITLQLWLLKKNGKEEEIEGSKSQWSQNSKDNFGPNPGESISFTLSKENQKDIINKTISKDLFTDLNGEEEEEIFTPDKENFSPNALQLRLMKKKGKTEEIECSKCYSSQNLKDNFGSSIYPDENISLTLSKENQKDIINKTISKDLFSVLDGEEEEIFTPDKENFSPITLQLWLLKKNGKEEEIEGSKSQWSQNSKDNFGPNPGESISPTSKKENQTPKVALDQKLRRKPFGSHIKLAREQDVMALKNRRERVPFQSLKNSGGKRRSGTSCPVSAAKSIDVTNCGQILDKPINRSDIKEVQNKSWDMVVDTASLMNKESRKALQLLQGLKRTRLIVPRLVIRELESMKRQFTFFRRISEASLALEWIEECMVKTNRWIHIQSSVEEGSLVAPTPPASPQFQFSEDSWNYLGRIENSQPLSPHNCSIEIASPRVEDHILDFALLYRRKQNDGQLVLLSEDVTLKIKCMAEGLLCEPVQEFRESLVNPFSGRFLWNDSSPRGQTWSCQNDVVLREKYCRLPLRKSSKGVASGLKLILLHNSQYGH
ncbi:FHA domain-containing protein PS1 [Gastrolobium bilobum]|uniref:FHA domain-containing protein PS1 n=1 Tax=Gastrolobium bilobum TaxID=150636 RepID=UPI002AB284C7|nr:FHA domain-containing protein PS1 [Gastrolobium bilobum]